MSIHTFDPDIAEQVGLNAAVIYQNIKFWCAKNEANGKHFYEEKYWTYNSIRAFEIQFSYLSSKQIRTALEKLETAGLIATGNFNPAGYDRTKWFCLLGQSDLPIAANGIAQKGEPIPDSKPDSKPDISDEEFDVFYSEYPKKVGKGAARRAFKAARKKASFETILEKTRAYAKQREGEDAQFTAHPATWLNGERWEDTASTSGETRTQEEIQEAAMKSAIDSIKSGKAFLCGSISFSQARYLVEKGHVTEEECRKVGRW